MIRLVIADDHAIVRKGLRQIVQDADDIEVIGEAGSSREVLQLVEQHEVDVVSLDISMPGRSGLDTLKQLKKLNRHVNVVILTMHPEEQYAIRAMKAGASGYLTKESAPDELIKAIREASQGRKFVTRSLTENLLHHLTYGSEGKPHERLSDREYEIMCLLASGKAVKKIAVQLSLGTKSIYWYRSRILEKMNMGSDGELIRYAVESGLI